MRTCERCGAPRDDEKAKRHWAWCNRCYRWWTDRGRPEPGPPPPRRHQPEPGPGATDGDMMRQVAALTQAGLTARQIGWELGVTPRTVQRWRLRARIREQEQAVTMSFPAIPDRPDPESPHTYAQVALGVACYVASHDGGTAEALELADALGVPVTAFRAAQQLLRDEPVEGAGGYSLGLDEGGWYGGLH